MFAEHWELFEPGADGEVVDGLAIDLRLELSRNSTSTPTGALLVYVRDSLPVLNAVVTAVRQGLARASSSGGSPRSV